jgi:hypothetical protein
MTDRVTEQSTEKPKPIKIMIGIPMSRPIEFRVFESFVKMANQRGHHEYMFCMTQNSLVHDARESIVEQFLKSECEALMFIDSDMVFHPLSIYYLERHKLPFVTAKAFKRVAPYQPCFYSKIEEQPDGKCYLESPVEYGEGLLPIDGAGMACCLIRREVFDKVQKPYFFPRDGWGEDLSFCYKLKQAGVQMYVDTTLQFGHLAQVPIFEEDFKEYYNKHKHELGTLYVEDRGDGL